jgi:hypothetical protein
VSFTMISMPGGPMSWSLSQTRPFLNIIFIKIVEKLL